MILNNNSNAFTIEVNLKGSEFDPVVFRGEVPEGARIAFNTNYPYLGMPLGRASSKCHQILPYLPSHLDTRPILSFSNVGRADIDVPCLLHTDVPLPYAGAQAGPMLLQFGRSCVHQSIEVGRFKRKAVDRIPRVSVGLTYEGDKMLVCYTDGYSLTETASYLAALGARSAMCMAGGDKVAMLHYRYPEGAEYHFGKTKRAMPCGIALMEK